MNEELMERLLKSPRLPSLPTIALEVIDLVQQPDVNIKQIATTVQHDPALSSKILKTVNSSFYGQAHAVGTVTHALVVLGLNSVKTLALGFSLANNLKESGGKGFDHMAFWKRSLFTATAARKLARQMGLVHHEEAFLGGLLQDLGMLAMNQVLGDDYTRLLIDVGNEHHRLGELERKHFGLDHAAVGAALAQRWHLPPQLSVPIRHHEQPDAVEDDDARPLVQAVALGNRVADVFMSDDPGLALDRFFQGAEACCDLSHADAEPLLRTIHTETNEMRRLFDLPTGELGGSDEILARANEALLNLTLQNQQQTSELEQQNRQLTKQVSTDSLTGVANRGRFNQFIEEQFAAVREHGSPVSLLFLDADHFKDFNDTYGHQVGDRVLVELASRLQEALPDTALVARYGGEEFAVVLPGTDRRTAARLAEAARNGIMQIPVQSDDGETLQITASIGAATHDGTFFNRPEQLIKAADMGVYAAKKAGRNCVRIFTPRRLAAAAG